MIVYIIAWTDGTGALDIHRVFVDRAQARDRLELLNQPNNGAFGSYELFECEVDE